MAVDIGNLMIGLGVLITTIFAILFEHTIRFYLLYILGYNIRTLMF